MLISALAANAFLIYAMDEQLLQQDRDRVARDCVNILVAMPKENRFRVIDCEWAQDLKNMKIAAEGPLTAEGRQLVGSALRTHLYPFQALILSDEYKGSFDSSEHKRISKAISTLEKRLEE